MCKSSSNHRPGRSLADQQAHEHDHEKWSRRGFLSTLGMGLLGSAISWNGLPLQALGKSPFLDQLANSPTDRCLVLIQLSGGNDGLNTIVPVRNDIYYQKRPTIAIRRQDSILLSDDIGMHPSMGALNPLWDQGQMSVVHNVGYDAQNRSHSRSTDIWTSGSDSDEELSSGWIGRYLANSFPDYTVNAPTYPLGVRIGGSASVFESEFGNLGVTFGDASQFERFLEQGGFYNVNDVPSTLYGQALSHARKITNDSFKYLEAIETAANQTENLAEYPGGSLASSLAVVARMIRGGLGSRVYLVSHGGFDTHNSQGSLEGPHANRLQQLTEAIAAFYTDLASDDTDRRALTMTFSEFGRTLDENGNQGTDHGSSAPVLLFGPVQGGLVGQHASLQQLDRSGDPIYGMDYRSIYDGILRDWFEMSEEARQEVIPGQYDTLSLVDQSITSLTDSNALPKSFRLEQNYPNPFNPSTTIRFALHQAEFVQLEVFDMQGRLVKNLLSKRLQAGEHSVQFNAQALASASYLYRIRVGGYTETKTMTLIK